MTGNGQIAILAHNKFPDDARAAVGIIRYGEQDVVAVIDKARRSPVTSQLVRTLPSIPIVRSFEDIDESVDALYVGIEGTGQDLNDAWRRDIAAALEIGCEVVVAQDRFPTEDPAFAKLASEHGGEIVDVGAPPTEPESVRGMADSIDADILLTAGTDRYVGTSQTTLEVVDAARTQGIDAATVPTSRVGALIEGWGVSLDRVTASHVAGIVESLLLERGGDYDLLVVEGQGAIFHPDSSNLTCGLLHGAMPDGIILCHTAGRELMHGYDITLPPVEEYASLYERLAEPVAETAIVAGSLNTMDIIEDADAREAIDAFAERLGAPATDPGRFGADAIVEALESGFNNE